MNLIPCIDYNLHPHNCVWRSSERPNYNVIQILYALPRHTLCYWSIGCWFHLGIQSFRCGSIVFKSFSGSSSILEWTKGVQIDLLWVHDRPKFHSYWHVAAAVTTRVLGWPVDLYVSHPSFLLEEKLVYYESMTEYRPKTHSYWHVAAAVTTRVLGWVVGLSSFFFIWRVCSFLLSPHWWRFGSL